MKVLLVLEATLGGTGRHILDLASGLLEQGVEVTLIYSVLRADRNFLMGLEDLQLAPGFQSHAIAITRAVTFSDVASYSELWRYVRDHGPFDVIHAHSTKAGFLARLLLNRGRARVVYTPHGLMTLNPELTGVRRRAVCALEALLALRSDAVVPVSKSERGCAIESGIDPA